MTQLAVAAAGLVVAAARSSNDGAVPGYASFRGHGRSQFPARRFAEHLVGGQTHDRKHHNGL